MADINASSLTFLLPSNVPPPRFKLFQCVRLGREARVIIGMEYYDPMRSIVEQMSFHGWVYQVSTIYGKSTEELVPLVPCCDGQGAAEKWTEEELLDKLDTQAYACRG